MAADPDGGVPSPAAVEVMVPSGNLPFPIRVATRNARGLFMSASADMFHAKRKWAKVESLIANSEILVIQETHGSEADLNLYRSLDQAPPGARHVGPQGAAGSSAD